MRSTLLLLIISLPHALGHGHLLRAVTRRPGSSTDEVACAVNASPDECNGGTVKLRKLIPRSGNDGACAIPPGCELGCPGVTGSGPGGAPCATPGICDHCALEKTASEKAIVGNDGSKWWTRMPAAHWDEPDQWPIFPCMSREAHGARGTITASPGDSFTTTFYVNADHSGLYRFELGCGTTATNADYNARPVTQWKALHISKELAPGDPPLATGREVGSTRTETDAYWGRTVCTAAGCPYRMNGAAPQYPAGAFAINSAECRGTSATNPAPMCFIEDTFTMPASASSCPDGPATLRWMWNSAEGLETYANCLDLTIQGAGSGGAEGGDGTGGGGAGGGSGGGGNVGGGGGSVGTTSGGGETPGWMVILIIVLVVCAIGVWYYNCRGVCRTTQKAQQPATAAPTLQIASAVDSVSAQATPGPQSAPPPPPSAPQSLPVGWQEVVDPNTKVTYYYNASSGETTWSRPEDGRV